MVMCRRSRAAPQGGIPTEMLNRKKIHTASSGAGGMLHPLPSYPLELGSGIWEGWSSNNQTCQVNDAAWVAWAAWTKGGVSLKLSGLICSNIANRRVLGSVVGFAIGNKLLGALCSGWYV
ncbi:uncharacterized protein PADG_11389 [Paracoccidioides brasiliensis Pb18]|uniref:Uncharacterized protein n=1 Tax=Paracoccidioides brasiliensis (strain Pb18) TaxID=502780 RepID=A0A0A0HYW9_PARBD|nr:uncharacterized protein PADG_11389 [Paracoccidioides brasiliensis Pb18]KGM92560.1 hypothetical protein PADG_11389 [Paracoccidioides brasiliensis Pb18]